MTLKLGFIFEPLQIINHNNIEYNISNHQNFKRRGYKIKCKPMDFLWKIIPLPESWQSPPPISQDLYVGTNYENKRKTKTKIKEKKLKKKKKHLKSLWRRCLDVHDTIQSRVGLVASQYKWLVLAIYDQWNQCWNNHRNIATQCWKIQILRFLIQRGENPKTIHTHIK